MPFMPSSAMASASRNSVLRPPLPLPFSVIVVSPPEISTQGGTSGWPRNRGCRFERGLRRGDHDVLDARKPGIAWLRRLVGGLKALEHARRHIDLVFLDDGERVSVA